MIASPSLFSLLNALIVMFPVETLMLAFIICGRLEASETQPLTCEASPGTGIRTETSSEQNSSVPGLGTRIAGGEHPVLYGRDVERENRGVLGLIANVTPRPFCIQIASV
jgi:hypothetical protein